MNKFHLFCLENHPHPSLASAAKAFVSTNNVVNLRKLLYETVPHSVCFIIYRLSQELIDLKNVIIFYDLSVLSCSVLKMINSKIKLDSHDFYKRYRNINWHQDSSTLPFSNETLITWRAQVFGMKIAISFVEKVSTFVIIAKSLKQQTCLRKQWKVITQNISLQKNVYVVEDSAA